MLFLMGSSHIPLMLMDQLGLIQPCLIMMDHLESCQATLMTKDHMKPWLMIKDHIESCQDTITLDQAEHMEVCQVMEPCNATLLKAASCQAQLGLMVPCQVQLEHMVPCEALLWHIPAMKLMCLPVAFTPHLVCHHTPSKQLAELPDRLCPGVA